MNPIKFVKPVYLILLATLLGACAPVIKPPGKTVTSGYLLADLFVTADGTCLPLTTWQPQNRPVKAALIALHGFNDYRHFFEQPGTYFAQQGIISYAFDQRGFGAGPDRGQWSGVNAYIKDLALLVDLVNQKHPTIPLFLLGESMGGAVVIVTTAKYKKLPIAGLILAAPAVWARHTMPWYQQSLLWTLAHTMPKLTLTGSSMEIQASDNIEMLIALGKDPLVIKETRVDSIYGLVNLMDAAAFNSTQIHNPTLLLYGEKDEIIPIEPTQIFLHDFMNATQHTKTLAFYEQGYHMLLHDLEAQLIWNDIIVWIENNQNSLPSGADNHSQYLLRQP